MADSLGDKLDMTMRLAADRVLRAITPRRQAKVVVWASAALSVVAAARPDLLPPDLAILANILNVGAINSLLTDIANGKETDDERIAARMEALLPAQEEINRVLADLRTGQRDLLRALTRQQTWQQQMLRLQQEDSDAAARLLAGFADMTGSLQAILEILAGVATKEQVEELSHLVKEHLRSGTGAISVDSGGGAVVWGDIDARGDVNLGAIHVYEGGTYIHKAVQLSEADKSYTPPPLPDPNDLPEPGPLPPGSRMVFDRNPLFTGREDELRAIARAALYEPAGPPAVISTGIGGIGKTQLAVEFAYRYGQFFEGSVQWVSLAEEDADAVARELVACGEAMGLWTEAEGKELSTEEKVARTQRRWTEATPRLIIFDNCESQKLLDAWRPRGGGARSLVTSRDDTWPAGYQRVAVRTLPREKSIALLREYLDAEGRTEPDVALDAVAGELDDLPLALTLAGSALAASPSFTVEAYLTELRQSDPLQLLTPEPGEGPHPWTNHDLDVARTFAVSLERLRSDDATDAAATTLLAGATWLLHGEPFPRALLVKMLPGDDPRPADRAIKRLLKLGLLEQAGEGTLRLHRLLARFIAEALPDETIAAALEALEKATAWLLHEQNETSDPRQLRAWESQFRQVVDRAYDREDETAGKLCANFGYYLGTGGDLKGARRYSERALAILESVLGPEHPATAIAYNNLGDLLRDMGDLAGARPYLEQALAIDEKVLGTEHPSTASDSNNLGGLLWEKGDLAGARPYLERALAINERALGPEHPDTAGSLNNLGGLLRAMGDLAGARPYLERALAINERALGPEHPDTAGSLNNMGILLQDIGDLTGARPYFERALAICERVLGPDHPDTATSLNSLGSLLYVMGDLAGARPYFERALAIRERVLGPEHPDTAASLNNLGSLLQALGDLAGARPYLERALAIRERVPGPEHPDTATSLNNMGMLLQDMGDLAGARPYFERTLAIHKAKLGPDHPHTATSLNNMGALLRAMGDLAGAQSYFERTLAIHKAKLGPDHPHTATSLNNLGSLLQAMGDLAGARPYLERTLAIREGVLGPEHPDTALSLNNMGGLLQALGDLAGARPYFERALAIFVAKLGPDHPNTRIVRDNLARLSREEGQAPGA